MVGNKKRLSEKQQLAIVELTKAGYRTYSEVAGRIGISIRTLYNWRREPMFQEALDQAQSELRERIYSASEVDVKIQTLGSLIDAEFKLIDSLDVSEAIINLSKNQERLRARLQALTEEVEHLKIGYGEGKKC